LTELSNLSAEGVVRRMTSPLPTLVKRFELEIVKCPESVKGFQVLARRWVVERTFAWLSFHRRLSKNYEHLPATSEAVTRIAMIRLMLARLP
jgi:transposase